MNVTEISKSLISKKLHDFEQLTCKQHSQNSLSALHSLILNNPLLSPQFLRISMTKERLDLIVLILKDFHPQQPLKVITYLCKGMNKFQAKQISLIWNLLYSKDSTNYKYEVYYQCLVTFPFGGANREAQQTSLYVLLELIELLQRRSDNKMLSRISENYISNFKKYNVLNVRYFQVMNRILQISVGFVGFIAIDVYEMLNRYLTHLALANEKKWHSLETEILKGIGQLGNILLRSEYIVGSLFIIVLHHVEKYLENKIFGVRDIAREAIRTWKQVEKRVLQERKDKERILNSSDSSFQFEEDHSELKVRNMIDQTGKYLIRKQYMEKKAASQLPSSVTESLERKFFLKKKTGNGGGFIQLQNQSKISNIKSKYEQIIGYVIEDAKRSSKNEKVMHRDQLYLEEYEWYPNNSHITQKYNLEETVEYEKDEDLYLLNLMEENKEPKSVNIKQIEQLIDIAYSKIW